MADISFGSWYRTTRPRKNEVMQPMDLSTAGIEAFIRKNETRNDIGELIDDLGYSIYLKSGKDYAKAHVLSIKCGCFSELVSNCVALSIRKTGSIDRFTTIDELKKIYRSLAEIWHPQKGVIKYGNEDLLSDLF